MRSVTVCNVAAVWSLAIAAKSTLTSAHYGDEFPRGLREKKVEDVTEIPHRIWFLFHKNLLEVNTPSLANNVRSTVDLYAKEWAAEGDGEAPVVTFADEKDCESYVEEAEPDLLEYYRKETNPAFREDMCKVSLLYLHGGFLIGVDLKVNQPYIPKEGETFVTSTSVGHGESRFFTSFVAATPFHALLERALTELVHVYVDNGEKDSSLSQTLWASAYRESPLDTQRSVKLLQEINLSNEKLYPDVPRVRGKGNCHFGVVDPFDGGGVYFLSHIAGYGGCKTLPEDELGEEAMLDVKVNMDTENGKAEMDPSPTSVDESIPLEVTENVAVTEERPSTVSGIQEDSAVALGAEVTGNEIPRQLWFTYKIDLLKSRNPVKFHRNIVKTVELYRKAWGDSRAQVTFLDDKACVALIQDAEPGLLPYFSQEKNGAYRGDMCRTAVLYLHGGYYLDVDLDVVQPFVPEEGIQFATVESCDGGCFYTSFVAAKREHPVMKETLRQMLEIYENNMDNALLGQIATSRAYLNLPEHERGPTHLLDEAQLNPDDYPELDRTDRQHDKCLYAIHDRSSHQFYFFAHFIGSGFNCPEPLDGAKRIKTDRPSIPQRIWYAYEHDVLERQEPPNVYSNVQNTVELFRSEWMNEKALVKFLDENMCSKFVRQAKPELFDFYMEESVDIHRMDMCKIAVLSVFGGYYLDVDVKVIETFVPEKDEDLVFVSSCGGGCVYMSFLAVGPGHPVMKEALEEFLRIYRENEDKTMLGAVTLANALTKLTPEQKSHTRELDEFRLEDGIYPTVQRQNGVGNCDWVIRDSVKEKAYFFSHAAGFDLCHEDDADHSARTLPVAETGERVENENAGSLQAADQFHGGDGANNLRSSKSANKKTAVYRDTHVHTHVHL